MFLRSIELSVSNSQSITVSTNNQSGQSALKFIWGRGRARACHFALPLVIFWRPRLRLGPDDHHVASPVVVPFWAAADHPIGIAR